MIKQVKRNSMTENNNIRINLQKLKVVRVENFVILSSPFLS